jgi:serine/threonine protein kinase
MRFLEESANAAMLLICVFALQRLLVYDPSSRISARAAMAHPWFADLHPQYASFRNNGNGNGTQTFF